MRVLIEEIKGEVKLLSNKIDELVKAVDTLTRTTVTREELKLTIDPITDKIKSLEDFKNKVYAVVGLIAFGALATSLVHAIPNLQL